MQTKGKIGAVEYHVVISESNKEERWIYPAASINETEGNTETMDTHIP